MPERDRYIPGVPCWVDTSQPDPEAAVDFYSGLFGWEFEDVMPPGLGGQVLHRPPARRRRRRRRIDPRVGAADGDVGHVHLGRQRRRDRIQGARCRRERRDGAVRRHGRRPDGRLHRSRGRGVLRLAGEQHKGAQVVNEPGSVNFNGLNTRDVAGAKSFYGAVFGWETLGLGGGFEMWTLPGYGDFLERDDPDLRKRLAELGGRAGIRGRRGEHQPDRGRPARRPAALERDLRGSRRRRHRREGHRARRHGRRRRRSMPRGSG